MTSWRTDDLPTQGELEVRAYAAELTAKARAKAAKRAPDNTVINERLTEIEGKLEAQKEQLQREAERLASRKVKALVAQAAENVTKGKTQPARATIVRDPGFAKFFELAGK